jgi:NADPH-dependent ferric siderophore reductase
MPTAVAAPYRFFSLQVVRTRRLSPSLVRVTFAGSDLHAFASTGLDQSLSVFLPRPGQEHPVIPMEYGEGWRQAWIDTPEDVRATMRSYTLRALRRDPDEIDIDFVLHGTEPDAATPAGPASRWAADTQPGDRIVLLGPAVADNTAIRFRPPIGTDLIVLWADETALPAAAAILESLPAGTTAAAWLEVPHAADRLELVNPADADITWLVRDEDSPTALEAIRAAQLPPAESPCGTPGCSFRARTSRRRSCRTWSPWPIRPPVLFPQLRQRPGTKVPGLHSYGERIRLDWNWKTEEAKAAAGSRMLYFADIESVEWHPAVGLENGYLRFTVRNAPTKAPPKYDPNSVELWGFKKDPLMALVAAAVQARLPHPSAPPIEDRVPLSSDSPVQDAVPPTEPDHDALLRRLRELGELHKSGVLTEEEFTLAKQAILKRL